MNYKIINSGSDGNCTIIEDKIAIDMGVNYKKLGEYAEKIKLVLLTHIHGDHFNKTTIKKLYNEHPTVKFVCLSHLVDKLIEIVDEKSIFVLEPDELYDLGICKLSAFMLMHDVINNGWRILINNERCIYATDTTTLDNITAKNYDLYLIEANYDLATVFDNIRTKTENNQYCYEYRAMNNHLSIQQCNEFLIENMGENSKYEYMHRHKERKTENVELHI